jgi:hypothetical protein
MADGDETLVEMVGGAGQWFFEPIDPPLHSRRHFIPCRSCQPPKLFVPMPLSGVPYR